MAAYTGVCGSLAADLSLAAAALFVFAMCAGTETAITTLWPWKVREYAQREKEKADAQAQKNRDQQSLGSNKEANGRAKMMKGGKRAPVGKWTALREDIQRFMQTILIGATLSGVVSTAFITEICGQLFGSRGLAIATIAVTLLQLTLCEILPKSMAVSSPYTFAQAMLPFFYRASAIVYPVSKILNEVVSICLKVFGISVDTSKTPYVSEEELDLIFNSAMKSGIVDADEGEMISSVRNLDKKSVKEIMTPLVDMIGIEVNEPISELRNLVLETQFSRLPVFAGRFDTMVGVVSMKMLLRFQHENEGKDTSSATVGDICDKPYFVPETMSLLNALRSLKERTIAICVDEYGGTTGLVTLEDVLEEIVGEIYDSEEAKDDLERAENRSKITQLGPGTFSMSATADIADVSAVLEVELPEGDYYSIGGFICSVMDRIPMQGEAVMVQTSREEIRFEVVEVDDRKIVKIVSSTQSAEGQDGDVDGARNEEGEKEDEEFASVLDVRPEVELTPEDMLGSPVDETEPAKTPRTWDEVSTGTATPSKAAAKDDEGAPGEAMATPSKGAAKDDEGAKESKTSETEKAS